MSVSADGTRVYAAVFESGNASTILGGGLTGGPVSHPKNVVSDPLGPYAASTRRRTTGRTSTRAEAGEPRAAARRHDREERRRRNWMDDNGGDWTSLVSGPQADRSDRPIGWDLPDRDLAVIDASALTVQSYTTGLMNMCMAIGVNPASGDVVMVGTDATNEIRFEPLLNGTFVRVNSARINATGVRQAVNDLNTHLDYSTSNVPQATRDLSIGDPRAVIFRQDGTRGWVAGMGSNNVIRVNGSGERSPGAATIEVGEGPTGLALDDGNGKLYVLSRFEATVSVIRPAAGERGTADFVLRPDPGRDQDGTQAPLRYARELRSRPGGLRVMSRRLAHGSLELGSR